jgi:hypothetical protein
MYIILLFVSSHGLFSFLFLKICSSDFEQKEEKEFSRFKSAAENGILRKDDFDFKDT